MSNIKKTLFYMFTTAIFGLVATKKYKTDLIYSFEPNQENINIMKKISIFNKGKYQPSIFTYWGIFQRIYVKYFEQKVYIKFKQQKFENKTYYYIPLHHQLTKLSNQQKQSTRSIAIVIGGSQGLDNTMKILMNQSHQNGFQTIGVIGDEFNNTKQLDSFVQHIKDVNKIQKIYGIGLDYGANMLVKFAAQYPYALNGLVSIGNPLDLELAETKIEKKYLWRFILYKDILNSKMKRYNIKNVGSLYNIDKIIHPNEDIKKWKQQNSSINFIDKLKINSLFIQSQQDPFAISLQDEERLVNQKCIFIETQGGGHTQWLQSHKLERWIVKPVLQYLIYLSKTQTK